MEPIFDLSSYRYSLPPELIAQEAVHPHHNARLLVGNRWSGEIAFEWTFFDLSKIIEPDRVLFFNNSRVLPARIPLKNHKITKSDGTHGSISEGEILFCQKCPDGTFEALVRPGKKFQIGIKIHFDTWYLEIAAVSESGRILKAHDITIEKLMETYGELPLPPYITYSKEKERDYQTSFAKIDGSVAAPTASLHFTRELMDAIENPKEYITLHVGLGTFKGIDTSDIRDYHIHAETIEIPLDLFSRIYAYKTTNKKLIAVGTTVCRTLESLPSLWKSLDQEMKEIFDSNIIAYWNTLTEDLAPTNWIEHITYHSQTGSLTFSTSIYITSGYIFRIVDELITNFHLPESSLLVLISAFMGKENVDAIYNHAIQERYRFFSFGDGMYIRSENWGLRI